MRLVLVLVSAVLSFQAHADQSAGRGSLESSGSSGNGGQLISCSAVHESYDLFEGQALFGYNYSHARSTSPLAQALKIAVQLDRFETPPVLSFADRVQQIATFVEAAPDRPWLALTGDIEPTDLPASCALTQVFIFHDNATFTANLTAFHSLANESKAALYLHEAIYWYLREAYGDTTSRRTRRFVSYLLNGGRADVAVSAMRSYDPTPLICTELSTNNRPWFVTMDPSGHGTLFSDQQGGYVRSTLTGGVAAGSLVSASAVGFALRGHVGGAGDVQVDVGGQEVTLKVTGGRTFSCSPFAGVLP